MKKNTNFQLSETQKQILNLSKDDNINLSTTITSSQINNSDINIKDSNTITCSQIINSSEIKYKDKQITVKISQIIPICDDMMKLVLFDDTGSLFGSMNKNLLNKKVGDKIKIKNFSVWRSDENINNELGNIQRIYINIVKDNIFQ